MSRVTAHLSLCALLASCSLSPVACQEAPATKQAPKQPENVTELLSCLDRAAASLQDYTVTGITETNGKKQQFTMTYRRPNLVRIDTHKGQIAVQPNGDIKGRLGHGPFGKIAQRLRRDDKRLLDAEGIPFYASDFVSMLARVHAQVQGGASATMTADKGAYYLKIRSGETIWKYTLARSNYSLQESSRWVAGKQLEITRFSDFHANSGITTDRFKF